MKKKICFLVSGNGGTLKFLQLATEYLNLPFEIHSVISFRECGAKTFAEKVPTIKAHNVIYSRESPKNLQTLLKFIEPDIIITNVNKIIDGRTLELFDGKFFNLHYSLLPAFRGLIGMEKSIDAARKAHTRFIGATFHRATVEVDAGEIIAQAVFPTDWNDLETNNRYNTMFRAACLSCLSGLNKTSSPTNEQHQILDILGTSVLINPAINFNINALNEAFWDSVSQL